MTVVSPIIQAGYTGGAPGTPTYDWVWISQNGAIFDNPVNASSQSIQRDGLANNSVVMMTFRCDVTDPQGHVATGPTVTANFSYDNFN